MSTKRDTANEGVPFIPTSVSDWGTTFRRDGPQLPKKKAPQANSWNRQPPPDYLIGAGREGPPASAGERDAIHVFVLAAEVLQLLVAAGVPQADRLVEAAGEKSASVRRYRQARDLFLMSAKTQDALICVPVPEGQRPVSVSGEELWLVGMKGNAGDYRVSIAAAELLALLAGGYVPQSHRVIPAA
jgi:hypothetical protein